ncbi:hypothetical protein CsatB_015072 [Cannabis sativa]
MTPAIDALVKTTFRRFSRKLLRLPDDIEWHFIGHLQSNKVKSLLGGVPNISMVEGVHGEKSLLGIYIVIALIP